MEDYDLNDEAGATAFKEELQQFFAGLSPDRFPHLVDMAGPLGTGDRDERFEFGLDLLVRGIASTAASQLHALNPALMQSRTRVPGERGRTIPTRR